jgi:hypothetical protein
VLVGGSPVMSGVDVTMLEGMSWRGRRLERGFNLGLPLGTVVDVSLAVEHGLSARPPRLLVYGVALSDLNGNRAEPQGQRQIMNLTDLARWVRLRPGAAARATREFLLDRLTLLSPLAHHGDGLRYWAADRLDHIQPRLSPNMAATARQNLAHSAELVTSRGHLPGGEVSPEQRLSVHKARGEQEWSFPFLERYDVQGHLPYLRRLMAWARDRGVELVLLEMPLSADVERLYPREYEQFRAVLPRVAQAHGVRLLRPTREQVGLTDADYLDLAHLNADGVRRFTAWLRQTLEQVTD